MNWLFFGLKHSCLRYCKYMGNINYLSICIFEATVKEVSRTSFAKLKPDTNDISFRVTKDINFPNIFALGRKKTYLKFL